MNIRGYDNIQAVLKEFLKTRSGRPLSIRQLSAKLGYASDRTLGMVIQGERNMGAEMLRRLADYAQLNRTDKDYLALLALKQKQVRQGQPTQNVENLIFAARAKAGVARKVTGEHLHALTAWFAYSVIETLRLFKSPATAAQIAQKLRGQVPIHELKQCLEALSALNYIQRSDRGHYRDLRPNEYITTPVDIPSATVRQIHRNQLQRAMATLEEQAVFEREFISKTFIIAESRLPALKARIREMMEELAEQFVAPEAEDGVVVQLNQQLYQQTKPRARGSD